LSEPDAVVEGVMGRRASASALAVADIDGDGVADLVEGIQDGSGDGFVSIAFGPMSGTMSLGDGVTITPMRDEPIGEWIAAGDADGDGYGDVLMGSWSRARYGQAHMLLGPLTADASILPSDLILHRPPEEQLGFHMAIAPDVDGDDVNDILISAPWGDHDDGAVYLVPGTTTGLQDPDVAATHIFRGDSSDSCFGMEATILGDTDGDGVDDLAAGCASVHVVPGGSAVGDYEVSDVETATIGWTTGWSNTSHDARLASVDYDQDGYGDLLVGEPFADPDGAARLYPGPLAGDLDSGDAVATWQGSEVGWMLASGDCTGDGEPDLLFGGVFGKYLSVGPVTEGAVDVDSLPSFETASYFGDLLFAPDWSGDGVQEIVVGEPAAAMGLGAAEIYFSDRFQ
jgi:hypothetical protein